MQIVDNARNAVDKGRQTTDDGRQSFIKRRTDDGPQTTELMCK